MSDERHEDQVLHSNRFRKVANDYAHAVALAYGRDLAASARESDEQVAIKVREWEIAHGLEPRNWVAIGIEEGRGANRP